MFPYSVENPDKIRGVIALAAAIPEFDYSLCANRAFGLINGTADQTILKTRELYNKILENGGSCLNIEKEEVYHTDSYYNSDEFREDWISCYNFIMDFEPGPQVELLLPEKNVYAPPEPVRLSWQEIEGATVYEVKVFDVANFYFNDTVSESGYLLKDLEKNKIYNWQVRHFTKDSAGYWSHIWTFRTRADLPRNAVKLLVPGNLRSGVSKNPMFSWEASEEGNNYHLKVFEDSFGGEVYSDSTINSNSTSKVSSDIINLEANQYYWWQVRCGNIEGWGPWSDTFIFNTFTKSPYHISIAL